MSEDDPPSGGTPSDLEAGAAPEGAAAPPDEREVAGAAPAAGVPAAVATLEGARSAPPPRAVGSPIERVVEYFTLRRAMEVEARLGERARAEIASALALGIQKAEAAEALWENGHSAEGLRLGASALEATLAVAPIYAEALGIAPEGGDASAIRREALAARGLSADAIAAIEGTLEEVRAATLPVHERDVAPAHTTLWRRMAEAQHRAARAFRDAGRTRRELRFARGTRLANWALVAALALIGVWLATRTPEGVFVEASGTWADAEMFSPEKAIDGRPDTWWLAPDGVEATLDVRISPPRRLQRIRLLNGTNPPHHDRGTRDYTLEVYADGRAVRTLSGTLEHQTAGEPEYVEHEVGVDRVERVRFVARTHYRIGAGLAELALE